MLKNCTFSKLPFVFNEGQYKQKPVNAEIKVYEWDSGNGAKVAVIAVDKPNREDTLFATDVIYIYPDGTITIDANIDIRKVMI